VEGAQARALRGSCRRHLHRPGDRAAGVLATARVRHARRWSDRSSGVSERSRGADHLLPRDAC